MLTDSVGAVFGDASDDEEIGGQFSPADAGSATVPPPEEGSATASGSSPQTRPAGDCDSARRDGIPETPDPPQQMTCDEIPETPDPPQQRACAAASLSRSLHSPGEGENRSAFPMIRLEIEAVQKNADVWPTRPSPPRPSDSPSSSNIAVLHLPHRARDEDEAVPGSSVHSDFPASLAMASPGGSLSAAHTEDEGSCRQDGEDGDRCRGAGAGSAAEAGAVETGGRGAGGADRNLAKGIRRGCLRARSWEVEGGEGAGDGRGDTKRRVGFSDVWEEHVVPLEPRRNEEFVPDVSHPRPDSEPATC